MLAAGAASDRIWQQGYTNVFGVFTPASRYAVGMLNLALLHDLMTIAVVYPDDPFSVSAAQGVKKWAPKLGLDIVMFEQFEKGRRDLFDLARRIALVRPALVMMTGHFNESVDMRQALKKVDWYPNAYYATIGPVLNKYQEMLGEDAELSFANSFWEPALKFPQSQKFAADFRDKFGMTPSYQAADAYAAGQILARAITSSNSLSPDKIRSSLHRLEMQTVIGRYGVDPTGVQIKHFALTVQWQKGKKEIVWPEELATKKPVFK
jgi:branched-chain amino acid transport system substrate-binding protein